MKSRTLHYAASAGDIATMRRLLSEGATVDAIVDGQTAVHAAVRAGRTNSREDVVEFLAQAGANIDALDQNRCTALMNACLNGKVRGSKMALKLIELGADVKYVRQSDMASAIRFAVTRATPEVLNALIDHGAPVDGPRNSEITPLMKAAVEDNLDAVKVLVDRGADLGITCTLPWARGKTAEQIAEQEKKSQILAYLRSKTPKS